MRIIIAEYSRLVNYFIDQYWGTELPEKLIIKIEVDSWLSNGLKRDSANEAVQMIKAVVNKKQLTQTRPEHNGKYICLRDMRRYAELQLPEDTTQFDYWLHIKGMGDDILFDLPIKSHKHFKRLQKKGRMNQACIISPYEVQFSFAIETGTKHAEGESLGIDLGINHFLATSNGELLGDIKPIINSLLRKKHGSKARKGQAIHLRNEMNRTIKSLPSDIKTLYVERLKNISKGTKQRRVQKRTRCLIGSWNQAYALERIKRFCEDNRVAYRSVNPYKTSVTCSACGKADKRFRKGELFECSCGHKEQADLNAAKNILARGKLDAVKFEASMVESSPLGCGEDSE